VQPNTAIGCECKTFILNKINKRFKAIEQVHLLAISTLLDPRFKKIYFHDRIACSHAVSKVTTMLYDIESKTAQHLNIIEDCFNSHDKENAKSPHTNSIWQFHKSLVKEKYTEGEERSQNVIGIDFKNYLNQPVEDLQKCDPLKYWNYHKDTSYKNLKTLAYRYLCIVATSVPSERLFSLAGNIVTPIRNRLSGERLHKLLFLKSLDKHFWDI